MNWNKRDSFTVLILIFTFMMLIIVACSPASDGPKIACGMAGFIGLIEFCYLVNTCDRRD